jgi:hypothetical protein
MALKPWPLASVVANTATDWVVPGANLEVAIVGLIICNTGTVETADVTVTLTSSTGTVKATPVKASVDPGESIHIDTKIFLAASATPDKLRVLSTLSGVSFLASGDEG